jgi:hypothetical protein
MVMLLSFLQSRLPFVSVPEIPGGNRKLPGRDESSGRACPVPANSFSGLKFRKRNNVLKMGFFDFF